MKFCKLGICTKFIEKLCKFFVQLVVVDRGNFREFKIKFYGNFHVNFENIFNEFWKKFEKLVKFWEILGKFLESFEYIL